VVQQWLTRDLGRLSTVAKGARRTKSPFRGKLDLFYLADLSFQRSQRSELHTLREVIVHDFHASLRENLCHLQQAAYFVHLIEQSTEKETPLPGIFVLITEALETLTKVSARPLTVFGFEMKLLRELGLHPKYDLSPGSREILSMCVNAGWSTFARLKMAPAQVSEISKFLNAFITYHLGRVPMGRAAALAC
jgi:DNA repair protein RecO (recombination protein O)